MYAGAFCTQREVYGGASAHETFHPVNLFIRKSVSQRAGLGGFEKWSACVAVVAEIEAHEFVCVCVRGS